MCLHRPDPTLPTTCLGRLDEPLTSAFPPCRTDLLGVSQPLAIVGPLTAGGGKMAAIPLPTSPVWVSPSCLMQSLFAAMPGFRHEASLLNSYFSSRVVRWLSDLHQSLSANLSLLSDRYVQTKLYKSAKETSTRRSTSTTWQRIPSLATWLPWSKVPIYHCNE